MGITFDSDELFSSIEPGVALNLGIGLAYGLGLYVLMKIWKSFVIFPASFLVAGAAFQLAMIAFGVSGEEARAAGFVFSGMSGGELWPPIGPSDLPYIEWVELAGQVPNLLILFTVTLVCVVMNLGGVEVAANADLDWNREFRVTGWANAVTGVGGAPPGCLIATTSIRNVLFGATTRLTGLFTALALAACLVAGDTLLGFFPIPLIGGVLLFLGLHMMEAWLIGTLKRLAWADYLIILVMFATIVVFGFLEGGRGGDADHHRDLRDQPEPDGCGPAPLHGARPPEQPDPADPGARHPPRRRQANAGISAPRATCSSVARIGWPTNSSCPSAPIPRRPASCWISRTSRASTFPPSTPWSGSSGPRMRPGWWWSSPARPSGWRHHSRRSFPPPFAPGS